MRVVIFLCLLLVLSACAVPGQDEKELRAPPETPAKPPVQPTTAPTEARPAAPPKFESSVLLSAWNASEHRREIRPVDPATGQDVPGYSPIIVGGNIQLVSPHVFSAHGKKLAAIESRGQSCEPIGGGTACRGSADVLHLIDLAAWREVTATLPTKGWVWPLALSPDTTRLALAYHQEESSTLMLFDAGTGKVVAQRALEFRPSLMEYAQDGTSLVIYGQPLGSEPGISQPAPPRVLLLDAATLDVKWDQSLASIISGSWCLENCQASHEERLFASWWPAVVLSHDGRKLYIVHADEERLTTVDFDARTVRSVEIQAARSWFERLLDLTAGVAEAKGGANGAYKSAALSADGKRLYLVGQTTNAVRNAQGRWDTQEVSIGLQVIDVESGLKLARRESEAENIDITPDGAYLLLDGSGEFTQWMEVLNAESLEGVRRLEEGWRIVAARRMDGQPIMLAYHLLQRPTQLAVFDPRSFEVIHAWTASADASWVTAP